MRKSNLVLLMLPLLVLVGACGRQPLSAPSGSGGGGGSGAGGSTGSFPVVVQLPDGGLPALIVDGGLLGGILDAQRDSLIARLVCGPEAKLGAPCSSSAPPCVLPSLGGACACVNGTYVCPLNPSQGPGPCPQQAASGGFCFNPLSVCIGGGANICICGVGSYTCL
jgi:hypothetical protein